MRGQLRRSEPAQNLGCARCAEKVTTRAAQLAPDQLGELGFERRDPRALDLVGLFQRLRGFGEVAGEPPDHVLAVAAGHSSRRASHRLNQTASGRPASQSCTAEGSVAARRSTTTTVVMRF